MILLPPPKRQRLSGIELDNTEPAEKTDLRAQLLSRKYFIFDLSKNINFLTKGYGDAYLSVFVHIQCIRPKFSIQELRDRYVRLVAAEREFPIENHKSFENLLGSRLMKLLRSLEIDLMKVLDTSRKLVYIFNNRVLNIQASMETMSFYP